MEEFLGKVIQLLPILGSDVLTPMGGAKQDAVTTPTFITEIKGLVARGRRTPTGFLVFADSQAVAQLRGHAENQPAFVAKRQELLNDGSLVPKDGHLVFTHDVEFSSPSPCLPVSG